VNKLFDQTQLLRQRTRALKRIAHHHFLFEETALRLCERLDSMHRNHPITLNLAPHYSLVPTFIRTRFGIETLIESRSTPASSSPNTLEILADEQFLPLAPSSLDMVISSMALHWVDDLPGTLIQIRQTLKPNGLFLANIIGGTSLLELRDVLAQADIIHGSGMAARVIPVVEVKALGMLLQRAGFDAPVTDSEIITVHYTNILSLMHDLRYMGEGNALLKRSRIPITKSWLATADALYKERYSDGDGGITAQFEILTMTALAPQS
jgi:hypothetical protein